MKKEMTVKEFASLGGDARAKKLSKERLSEIGKNASDIRWGKKKITSRKHGTT